ncbi:hypothetical protein E4U42_002155 [Claviceps africana]|uniref:UBL3-like ubiquitin domain-containing protein n=1 Tax=Claviceps africana TaxID=83212 RepID=A0A8K0J957_9HYPO|nr:hypothetical protein E4U42_002155 [Claviceps africana]
MDPTAMSGGNDGIPASAPAIAGHDARLGQPTDAVPMENMANMSPTDAAHEAEAEAVAEAVDVENPSAVPADTRDEAPASEALSKGKEKEQVPAPAPTKERSNSTLAIGPAHDDTTAAPGPSEGPVCNITLLLTSGSRHPYRIDAKYLSRRNVAVPDQNDAGQPDPFSISIYTLKELILREWRSDWEAKPASPSSIRLIHFGKLLDDKEQLKKYQFSTETPNVVHMSIRPQDLDEEDPKSGSKSLPSGRGDGPRSRASGACCAIL